MIRTGRRLIPFVFLVFVPGLAVAGIAPFVGK
jgi:hypothetical protein